MSEIDAVLYEYVKFIHVIYGSFSVFRLQPLYAFFVNLCQQLNKKLLRVEHCLTRFGFRWGIRRWVGPGMALTTIGEVPQ